MENTLFRVAYLAALHAAGLDQVLVLQDQEAMQHFLGRMLEAEGRKAADKHTSDEYRPASVARHQERGRQRHHHRGQKLQREWQCREPCHRGEQHTDKRGVDNVDVHRRHRQCLRHGKPAHITILV